MKVYWQRHIVGQTRFGIFSNVFTVCEQVKYLALHFGESRLEIYWGRP